MTDPPPHRDPPATGPGRRGVLDPLLSNRDGLLSGLEPARAPHAAAEDRWSHRRGEPRLLVLLWAVYLLAASTATILRMPDVGFVEPRFVQAAARTLVLLVALGLTVLWPMVRLSQTSPRRPALAAAVDLIALAAPLTAVLWPVTWLGGWGWDVTASLLAMLVAWGGVMAAVVAAGTVTPSGRRRAGWALALVIAVLIGPAAAGVLSGTGVDTRWMLYASPLTAVYALTTEPGGQIPVMTGPEWWSALGPGGLAAAGWALVAVRAGGHSHNAPGVG